MSVLPDSRKVCTYLRLKTPPSTVAISVTFAADPEIPPASFVESAFRALYNPCIPHVRMHDLRYRLSRIPRCRGGGSRKQGPLATPDEEIGAQGEMPRINPVHSRALGPQPGKSRRILRTRLRDLRRANAHRDSIGRRGAEEVGKRRRRPRRERMTADEVVGRMNGYTDSRIDSSSGSPSR